jgi:predicted Zn finger-like uncharacterized protein
MALATRCPKCQSLFRVVADQLKLRGGLVRCGSCRHVFDAIGSLAYVEDNAVLASPVAGAAVLGAPGTSPSPQPAPAAQPSPPRERAALSEKRIEPGRRFDIERAASEAGVPTLILTDLPTSVQEELQADLPAGSQTDVPTDVHSGAPSSEGYAPRGHREAASGARGDEDDPERKARRERRRKRKLEAERTREAEAQGAGDDDEAAPEFLQGNEPSRGFSIVFGGGSLLLLTLMLAQLAVIFRVELSTQSPALRPALVQLCKPFNCTLGWPTRAELLAVMGTELQAVPGTDILELTAVIRNRAGFVVALPAIEITLTDTQNRDVARKVFAPVDYLASSGQPSSRIQEGLASGADYEVRIHFEARGLSAAGYRVYPFYL